MNPNYGEMNTTGNGAHSTRPQGTETADGPSTGTTATTKQSRPVNLNGAGINNKDGFRIGGRFASDATRETVEAGLQEDKAAGKVGGNLRRKPATAQQGTSSNSRTGEHHQTAQG